MPFDSEDTKAWFACYTAALTGVLAAHAGSGALPDAPVIAKMARSMADAAIEVARQRWPYGER